MSKANGSSNSNNSTETTWQSSRRASSRWFCSNKEFTSFVDDSSKEMDKIERKFDKLRTNKFKEINEIKSNLGSAINAQILFEFQWLVQYSEGCQCEVAARRHLHKWKDLR